MTIDQQNLKMVKGTSLPLRFTIKDSSGAAVNISGATIKYQVRKTEDADAIVTKTLADGITITDGALGKFTVLISPGDTDDVVADTYFHEAFVTLGDGTVFSARNSAVAPNRLIIQPGFVQA